MAEEWSVAVMPSPAEAARMSFACVCCPEVAAAKRERPPGREEVEGEGEMAPEATSEARAEEGRPGEGERPGPPRPEEERKKECDGGGREMARWRGERCARIPLTPTDSSSEKDSRASSPVIRASRGDAIILGKDILLGVAGCRTAMGRCPGPAA